MNLLQQAEAYKQRAEERAKLARKEVGKANDIITILNLNPDEQALEEVRKRLKKLTC